MTPSGDRNTCRGVDRGGGVGKGGGRGGGVLVILHGRNPKAADPRIPLMSGRSPSGFH